MWQCRRSQGQGMSLWKEMTKRSMTCFKKITTSRSLLLPPRTQQSLREPGTAWHGCGGTVQQAPGHRGLIVCLVNSCGGGCRQQVAGQEPQGGQRGPGCSLPPPLYRDSDTRDCAWDWWCRKDGDPPQPWHCSWGICCPHPLQPFFLQSLPPLKSAALGLGV